MSGVTPVRTVGAKYQPGPSKVPGLTCTVAPWLRASSTWAASWSRWALVTMGPTWVAGLSGSPTTRAFIASTKRSMNSSAIGSTTMKRLAAMQDCPLLSRREVTPVDTAAARSADSSTMNGSDPPSSSTLLLSMRPAVAATEPPARSLPVSVTAAIRGSSMTAATIVGLDEQVGEDAFGHPGASEASPPGTAPSGGHWVRA